MPRTTEKMNAINLQIGLKIKALRISQGMSGEELAKQIDVSFQQVQKYELGANGLLVSRLIIIAEILGEDLNYFVNEKAAIPIKSNALYLKTLRDFSNIKNNKEQKAISDLIHVLGGK